MASMEDRIREYRSAASQKQAEKARAQAELDTAQERLETARKALNDEYGISTTEDAKELQEKLQRELEDAQADIEQVLAEAGA